MKDERSFDQSAQEALRIKAVKSLLKGKTQEQVAKIFGVTRQPVGKWWTAYDEGGLPALRKKSRRPKSVDDSFGLSGWQCSSIVRTIP